MLPSAQPITSLLRAHRAGDEGAFDQLVAAVYDELRRLARSQRRGIARSDTLDTTALVHEAYLKLSRSDALDARDREHFFAVAARAMRQIFVDYARGRRRAKRGGEAPHVSLDAHDREAKALGATLPIDAVIAVDQLLERLAVDQPRQVRVVECRWFAGYSEEETAEALGISLRTARRDWSQAKERLREALRPSTG